MTVIHVRRKATKKTSMTDVAGEVALLRRRLPGLLDQYRDVVEAVAHLIDHALRLEQAIDLIRSGVIRALEDAPENAILGRSIVPKRNDPGDLPPDY